MLAVVSNFEEYRSKRATGSEREVPSRVFRVQGGSAAEDSVEIERKAEWSASYRPNYYKGKSTEVFAIKRDEIIRDIQRYFHERGQWRDALYVALAVNMGLRGGDMVALRWRDVLRPDGRFKGPEEAYIYEQKTGKKRYLMMSQDVYRAIESYLDKTGIVPQLGDETALDYWIFPKHNGRLNYRGQSLAPHITRVSMGRILQGASKALGVQYRVGTHSLRKTFGYRLYKNGAPVELIQQLLNHSSSQVTLRYIGLTYEDELAALDNLESILVRMDDADADDN